MIELRGIGKTYQMGSTELVALADVNLQIARNEYVALIGPSGSGKSTMMNVLGCLDLPTTGTYTLDGEAVAGLSEDQLARVRNRKIGFIFQSYYLMPRTTIADNVAQPLIYRGLAPAVRRERANAALARVGLEARVLHKPNELSGGQRQRVAIARALVGRPNVLLADEPTGNLDSKTAREIMGVFGDLHREGMTIIIVTHDRGDRRVLPARDTAARRPHRRRSRTGGASHERTTRADRRGKPAAGVLLCHAGMPALRARQHPLAPHAQLPHHARRHHRRRVGHLHRLAAAGSHAFGHERVPGHRWQHVADPLGYVAGKPDDRQVEPDEAGRSRAGEIPGRGHQQCHADDRGQSAGRSAQRQQYLGRAGHRDHELVSARESGLSARRPFHHRQRQRLAAPRHRAG